MKKNFPGSIIIPGMLILLMGCNMATPENYFDQTVLNCNMMMGFAGNGLQRELEQPSAKLIEGTNNQSTPMKRKEVIDTKAAFLDQAFAKIKALKETADSREILKTSIALYEYVLPVYKNEYPQLAKLYDEGAPAEQINAYSKLIREKYAAGYEARLNAVINAGKPYAERHQIKVNWDSNQPPS